MWSVLERVDPGLVKIVRRADEAGRRRAVLAACRLAVARTGVTDDAVAAVLVALAEGRYGEVPERAELLRTVAALDDAAWQAEEQADAGGSARERDEAFARARAASSVAAALHLDAERAAAEALYEAHHALLDPRALRGAITSAVGGRRLLRRT